MRVVLRQIRFPTLLRGIFEGAVLGCVFLAAGHSVLGIAVRDLLSPMVPSVVLVLLSLVLSGVYRTDITNSIMNIYVHAAYGFVLYAIAFVPLVLMTIPELANGRFLFFFLFFAFFAFSTVSPLMSGTDFLDGGGRRKN